MGQPPLQSGGSTLLRRDGFFQPCSGSVQPLEQIREVRLAFLRDAGKFGLIAEPFLRNRFDDTGNAGWVQPRPEASIRRLQVARTCQEHMLGDLRKWRLDALLPAAPAVMEEQR